MIPAGVERDKVIAELRGEKSCMYYSGFPVDISGDAEGCTNDSIAWPDCDNCLMFSYKPYSTDIATAMTLETEMVNNGLTVTIAASKWGDGYKADATLFENGVGKTSYYVSKELETIEKAIADAISGAWSKWKESA
ncbi:hypothetical protein LCGC14_1237790 [marine sediment metagenome]|uniref:Uncharacterized protein n=1 Tax=marine sediment metagenome TaxID=412755 RepID=A0A0F9L6S0_9ZZZZ